MLFYMQASVCNIMHQKLIQIVGKLLISCVIENVVYGYDFNGYPDKCTVNII